MNKRKLFIGLLLASTAFGLAACGNSKPADNDNSPGSGDPSQVVKYTVTFVTNGGSVVSPVEVNAGEKLTAPTAPTKAEDESYTYSFAGWYKDATLSQEFDFNTETINSATTLYAKWNQTAKQAPQPDIFIVSFDSNGGTTVAAIEAEEGSKISAPTAPTKAADATATYEFAGWYKDSGLQTAFDFDTETITAAITLYAKWNATPVEYQVTFNSNGGTAVATQNIAYGQKASEPTAPSKQATAAETYTFAGWYTTADFQIGTEYDFNTTITGAVTLYAKWTSTPVEYTVTFETNGGTTVNSQSIAYGSKVTMPIDPTKDAPTPAQSYNFEGWYTNEAYTRIYDFNSEVKSSFTLYAKWSLVTNEYTIIFDTNGGSSIDPQSVEYGSKVIRPANPTKPEDNDYTYEFVGWYKDFDLSQEYNFDTEITSSLTLYAKWYQIGKHTTPNYFSVIFDSNGGSSVSGYEVQEGNKITKPTDPTKGATSTETYEFGGWYIDAGFNKAFDFDTAITANLTLYAKWISTPITYNVTYYNGNELLNTETVNAGSVITYDPPVITNYTFSGWYTDSSLGDNYYFENNTEIYAATTLYAKYTKTTAGSINVTSYKGYTEGIHLELDTIPGVSQTGYVVSYKSSDASSYTAIDNELIRINDNVVVDAVGLKAGTYSIKIEANNETLILSNVTVTKDDRSGYAHFNNSTGIGAYNNDGTLKSNAVVVYVTEATKNTVTASFGGKTYTGLYNIINNSKSDYPLDIRILGDIGSPTLVATNTTVSKLAEKNYDVKVMDSSGNVLSATKQEKTDGSKTEIVSGGYGTYDNSYTKLNGLTSKIIYGTKTYNGTTYKDYDSYFNMMDISSKSNITVEGIGADATITQWGFTWSNCSYIEVKNITFNNYPEDACSFQGSDTSATTLSGLKTGYIWIHNNTFNIGKNDWDVSYEQDKHEGDGATDIKGLRNATISYNHYYKNHKTGLLGGDGTHHQANITFHHNWYQENQARLPYGRQANMHMYNNFYDSSTGTNMQIHDGGYAFIENCYFKNTSKTFEVKTNKTSQVPAIKSYQNIFDNCKNYNITNVTITTNRTEVVSNDCLFGSSFDTDSSLFYYDSTNKCSNVEIMNSASELPTLLPTVSGAGVFASLVFPNQEQGDDPTPTPTGEFVEVFSDNFSSTTATKYNGVPTNAGLTYYTFLPDNASETGNPDTYNYVEVKNNAVSIVDTSSKTTDSGDDGMSRTTYAYYMFDSTNQYTSGVVKYSITINLPVVASKWRILTFIDESYNGVPSEMLALYSNADKKLGYIYGSTEETPFSSAYTNGTYTIELTIDYDNDTAVLSINGTSINISNYNPQTIKGFYFMTSAGSQRSYSFTNVKIEKQDN